MPQKTAIERVLVVTTPLLISINPNAILSGMSAFVVIVYYLSKLKTEVVNPNYEKSWIKYLKSIITTQKDETNLDEHE